MNSFSGYHSEWNLGSPGGWDYQRITQKISKVVWEKINEINPTGVALDFDHPMLYPVVGFTQMMLAVHRKREGANPGLIAVVAEEETLSDVTENINFADRLDQVTGITGILSAPHEFELKNGKVCHQGRPVSLVFMDFNNDIFLKLHRKHNLSPLLQAIKENRVLNPRGTEPINVKSMFEVITGPNADRFHKETVNRTPWTRRFMERGTTGPDGEQIPDLVSWARKNWHELVLKPERGYSGIGVSVGGVNEDGDAAIDNALIKGGYILQEKVPLGLWGEEMPEIDHLNDQIILEKRQTDFRCLIGPGEVFGFLCRFGDVPTNVGSGGGVQPLAILKSQMTVREAVNRINRKILEMDFKELLEVENLQKTLAIDEKFTYLLGPIKIALRPRIVTGEQIKDLKNYSAAVWHDSMLLEKMWLAGELDDYIDIEEEELAIAKLQPWQGSPAIFAADGLFGFGADLEVK
ncbi:MAG: hypothetical protein HF978_09285 [Desulfobacteraceae bacterium]|nr:hypothetical protein [Desulfobacteraceae bacterium]MBC2755728.1 hypothetical protein [Desulfobacteraceae bacterium]